MVACVVNEKQINQTVIVFSGKQGLGKTTWIEKLMPKELKQAHQNLDRAIEEIYRMGNPFTSDAERLEHLFKRYDEMTKKDTLFAKQKKTRKKKTD